MINRLSNFIESRRIREDIKNIIDNQNSNDILKSPVITLTENKLAITSLSGYHYDYNLKEDTLKIIKQLDKEINIINFQNEIKSLINENILNPLIEKKIKEEKELEIQQQAIYTEILSRLNQSNYTPHNYFKEINKWNQEQFENFVNKFNKDEISKFKELLLDCARDYEDKSISGDRMNTIFDNIASDHRDMYNKVEDVVVENFINKRKTKLNQKF